MLDASPQRPLPFAFDAAPEFDNFHIGENKLAFELLLDLHANEQIQQVYIWGGNQAGKTHLLTATHRSWLSAGRQSFYISLSASKYSASLLDGLDGFDLVLLDDINRVVQLPDWELGLFNLINFCRERGCKLLLSADCAPDSSSWVLPDLRSRLSWGPVLKLSALDEDDVRSAMFDSAAERGLKLESDAADFLLRRYSRDIHSVRKAIAILDSESLAVGRARITIPFIKRCLSLG